MTLREIFERVLLACYGRKCNTKSETKRKKELNERNITEVSMLGKTEDTSKAINGRGQTHSLPDETSYTGHESYAQDVSTIPKASKSSLIFENWSRDECVALNQHAVPEGSQSQLCSTLSTAGFKTKEMVDEPQQGENTTKSDDIVAKCPQNPRQLHYEENTEHIKQSAPLTQYEFIGGYYDVLASEIRRKLSESTEHELLVAVAEELAIEQTADELHMQELRSLGSKLNSPKYTPKISKDANSVPQDVLEYLKTCGNFR